MAIISNLLRLIAKPIFLKLGKGLKSSKTQYCLGDELDIRLDDSVGGKDNVIAKPPTKINSLVRWVDRDAKQITDSKTIQDDDGTTETTSTVDGALKNTLKNLSSNDLAQALLELITSDKGTPIIKLLAEKYQQYQIYLNRNDKSLMIAGHNFEDPTQSNNFWQITRRGAVKNLNQPQGLIVLETDTGSVIGANNWYRLGTKEVWRVIFDNYKIFTSLGGSAQNPLKAILNEGGSYQFKIGTYLGVLPTEARQTTLQFRILTKGREYFSFGSIPAGLTDGYLSDNIGVIADINDELLFEIWGGISGPKIAIEIRGTPWPVLYTGIFYYLMG